MAKKILIVDDSALIRRELGKLLGSASFEVEYAKNGQEAVEKTFESDFDAITMDINMPVMDGLSAVKIIMKKKPTPIVMVSSLTQGDADITFEALDYGAVDFVGKPGTITLKVKESGDEIIRKVTAATKISKNRLVIRKAGNVTKTGLGKKKVKKIVSSSQKAKKFVLVGSSTGGPGLIEKIAITMPADYPYPICVVQHMPELFTEKFAARLNDISNLNVVEAKNNEPLTPGKIIIGKGGYHMVFSKKASGLVSVKLGANTKKLFFTPSVDEMFFSAVQTMKCADILAIELTGIGDDGALGMVELKKKGAYTIAESKETATIYGMPRAAYEKGGTVKVLPFPEILKEILKFGGK
ncbi:MAG: chemotaxis-specific protein-glutamate methyltransferase CheB [Campylobacterota bacterium]|nr:chemotaxis-specific protein-glutamate methyltransferase CheB [Campylobacterota bacterium]